MRIASVLVVCPWRWAAVVRAAISCVLVGVVASVSHAQPLAQVELLHAFREPPGNPVGGLARAADGSFYGVTARVLYRVTSAGVLSVAHTFDPTVAGAGAPTIGPDGVVYGVVVRDNRASVFRFDPATPAFRILRAFDGAGDGHVQLGVGALTFGPDGFLYGTTGGYHPGSTTLAAPGSVYRVHPVTGAGATLHEFSGAAPALRNPVGGLVVAGGHLYGAARYGGIAGPVPATQGQGGIFRLDPATGIVTTVHQFSSSTGRNPEVGLTVTTDGFVYGTAFRHFPGGSTSLTHVFRFAPPAGALELVADSVVAPSQLAEALDGHLYFATEHNPQVFRVRRLPGGGHVHELVHDFVLGEGNHAAREALTLGLDGFLYGTARIEGAQRAGAIYKLDPSEAGGGGNPSQFAVVHDFPQNQQTWMPSVPVRVANGDLYGTTSRGGSTLRGAIYRLDGATGAVSILGVPDGLLDVASSTANSSLVLGTNGFLYGTSATQRFDVLENRIVRVNPANGAIETAHAGIDVGQGPYDGMTRTPDGVMYLSLQAGARVTALRFDPVTNGLSVVATRVSERGASAASPFVVGADGQLYMTIGFFEVPGGFLPNTTELVRLDVASGTFVTVAGPDRFPPSPMPSGPPGRMPTPIAAANGTVLVPVQELSGASSLYEVTPATGAVRLACAGFGLRATVGADGAPRSVDGRLRRCDVATGVVQEQVLPATIGRAHATPVLFEGVVHGAAAGGLYGGGTLFRLHSGAAPAFDSDGDGLSNTWETTYGLDPLRAGGNDGAGADPDGDGRTNAQELAAGTHPRGFVTRLFAEGATGPFFRTRLDITAPGEAATVRARFLTDTGAVIGTDLVVPASSHVTLDPAALAGLAHSSFSTIVESDAYVAVDRTMSWDPSGYGSHLETGIAGASTSWFFAEGATAGEFSLFYLLQNPQATAVTATVTYLRESGAPIARAYTLPPNSRTTIHVNGEAAELADVAVSAAITATAPIVAERAMYLTRPGQVFAAGHESAGVTAPALEWFFAEGATGAFFDLFVLIANPGSTPATVEVEYLRPTGGPLTKTYTVPAQSRRTIFVDDEEFPAGSGQKLLASGSVSTVVRSTNDVPIVAERAMWWPGSTVSSNYWIEAHDSPGATGTTTRWVLGGAQVGGADGADTFVLIANTTATTGQAVVSVLGDDDVVRSLTVDLPAKSRTTLSLAGAFASNPLAGQMGVVVESIGASPVPIVVERATYSSPGGVFWSSGGNALASPRP